MMAHAFNPDAQKAEAGGSECSLVYRASARVVRTQSDLVLGKTGPSGRVGR